MADEMEILNLAVRPASVAVAWGGVWWQKRWHAGAPSGRSTVGSSAGLEPIGGSSTAPSVSGAHAPASYYRDPEEDAVVCAPAHRHCRAGT
jgi:hypothetical protein